jgi:hypothetical protein
MFHNLAVALLAALPLTAAELPPNRWVELARDSAGARPGSAIRYAAGSQRFVLWGFMNDDPDLLQEQPLMRIPEYDVVTFDLAEGRWQSHLPPAWEEMWNRRLPLASVPRAYAGITTGSERTMMRVSTGDAEAAPRPDLNVVFDQVAYRPENDTLYYFTGGLTASYDVAGRRWSDLRPRHAPPPVLGGFVRWRPCCRAHRGGEDCRLCGHLGLQHSRAGLAAARYRGCAAAAHEYADGDRYAQQRAGVVRRRQPEGLSRRHLAVRPAHAPVEKVGRAQAAGPRGPLYRV